jgi:two-component system, chemotaxis family, protein-glutamate methylesterase/glutaminase
MPINVLICDDSALMRRSLSQIIGADPGLRVAGTARDGQDAIDKARELRPDVITMDINMPVIDGITAMQFIVQEGIAPVIMVSSLTQDGAATTFQAMALGAFDYVPKPGGTVSVRMESAAHELVSKIRAAARPGTLKRLTTKSRPLERYQKTRTASKSAPSRPAPSGGANLGYKAVAMGVSTGGPKTLFDVLPLLPRDLNAAVFLVQHMPGKFIPSFAKRIDDHCPMRCVEVAAGMEVEPGVIYIGTGEFHMTLYKKLSRRIVIRTPTQPVHQFMPSVDVMMQSVLEAFGADTIGVLMTGMGDDGADSMVAVHQAGGITIAESEESAIVFGMPQEAIKRGGARIIKPSWDIAAEIVKAVGK